jgi:hypothetical protein
VFSLTELRGQSSLLHKSGTIELNTEYCTRKKPVWLVMLKLLGVIAMVALGVAIALPTLLELRFTLVESAAIIAGAMLVYTGIAFFVRPEPNTDNLGFGGGMMNDPFQTSDNVNRFLWRLHCALGPGRFTAETLLDLCALLGLAKTEEAHDAASDGYVAILGASGAAAFDATRPLAPLDPNRLAQSSGNFVAGQIQLDSQRFFAPPSSAPGNQPVKV